MSTTFFMSFRVIYMYIYICIYIYTYVYRLYGLTGRRAEDIEGSGRLAESFGFWVQGPGFRI